MAGVAQLSLPQSFRASTDIPPPRIRMGILGEDSIIGDDHGRYLPKNNSNVPVKKLQFLVHQGYGASNTTVRLHGTSVLCWAMGSSRIVQFGPNTQQWECLMERNITRKKTFPSPDFCQALLEGFAGENRFRLVSLLARRPTGHPIH